MSGPREPYRVFAEWPITGGRYVVDADGKVFYYGGGARWVRQSGTLEEVKERIRRGDLRGTLLDEPRKRNARGRYAVCAKVLKPRRRRNPRRKRITVKQWKVASTAQHLAWLRAGAPVSQRRTRKRNVTRRGPRGELFSLIARKGLAAPMVYTGDKFARSGRPVLFPSLATAKATARFMQRHYPTLRGYSIWAREV